MGNTVKKKNLALIRTLLGFDSEQTNKQEGLPSSRVELMILLTGEDPGICKVCKTGQMVNITAISNTRIRYG